MKRVTTLLMIGLLLTLLGCSGQEKKTADTAADEISKSLENFQNRPIYKTLTTEIISKTKDSELEQTVIDNISINMEGNEEEVRQILKSLTVGQRAVYVTWIVEGEVNNGGFNQFYFNSSGQLADIGEEAFQILGANRFADLMKKANSTYDQVKDDLEKYNDGTIDSFSKSYKNNPLNDLDDKFYKLYESEPLSQIRIKYIRDNVKQFVTE